MKTNARKNAAMSPSIMLSRLALGSNAYKISKAKLKRKVLLDSLLARFLVRVCFSSFWLYFVAAVRIRSFFAVRMRGGVSRVFSQEEEQPKLKRNSLKRRIHTHTNQKSI